MWKCAKTDKTSNATDFQDTTNNLTDNSGTVWETWRTEKARSEESAFMCSGNRVRWWARLISGVIDYLEGKLSRALENKLRRWRRDPACCLSPTISASVFYKHRINILTQFSKVPSEMFQCNNKLDCPKLHQRPTTINFSVVILNSPKHLILYRAL